MSMEKDKIAYEQLLQGIQSYVNKCLGESNRDITTTGKIVEVVEDGGYTVEINGVQYSDIDTIGGECALNEMVKVVIPQGQYNNMFILKGDSGDITTGKIVEVVEDGGYTVEINGVQYSDIYTIGGKCTLNEMVRIVIPQGQYNNMFILKGVDFDQIYPIGSVYMSTEIINPATLFGGIWEQIKNNNISAVYMWKRTN